jgi:hypothetical protein
MGRHAYNITVLHPERPYPGNGVLSATGFNRPQYNRLLHADDYNADRVIVRVIRGRHLLAQ